MMDKTDIQPYWNEEHTKYAVLMPRMYYCGWGSTNGKEVTYDSRIVKYVITHPSFTEEELGVFLQSIGYNTKNMHLLSSDKFYIEWIDAGRKWRIADDEDYVEYEDDLGLISFE